MVNIKDAAKLEAEAARMVEELAGIEVDSETMATEFAAEIRRAEAMIEASEGLSKDAASERRNTLKQIDERCKKARSELTALSRSMRSSLLKFMRSRKDRAAQLLESSRLEIEAERKRLIEAGDTDLAELLSDPEPTLTDVEGVSISCRRSIEISDAATVCRAILSGELPHDIISVNQDVARKLIQSGHSTPGLSIQEQPFIVVKK